MTTSSATSSKDQKRIMLLTLPRSLSTIFTKWFSTVFEDTLVFHELYSCADGWGPDRRRDLINSPAGKMYKSLKVSQDFKDVPSSSSIAVDVEQCTYGWIKEQLENDYPEKKFLFCKDFAYALSGGKEDTLPRGYRYCFLIRHPAKVLMSNRKVMAQLSGKPESEVDLTVYPNLRNGYFYISMLEMWQYVKAELDPEAFIIDADDLCNHSSDILRVFCQNLDIPFSDDLLKWKPGDSVVKEWISVKMFLLGNMKIGYYKHAMESTEFKKQGPPPDHQDLQEDDQAMVDAMMPSYSKLYEARVKPE